MADEKATSFRLGEDLAYRFRVACTQKRTNQSTIVRSLIESWLSFPASAKTSPHESQARVVPTITPKKGEGDLVRVWNWMENHPQHRAAFSGLVDIFAFGSKDLTDATEGAIKAFAGYAKDDGKEDGKGEPYTEIVIADAPDPKGTKTSGDAEEHRRSAKDLQRGKTKGPHRVQ